MMFNERLIIPTLALAGVLLATPAMAQDARPPAEATPAEATPAEATPAEATPAEATPAEATPAEATPAAPAEATPAEATPAAPAEATPAAPAEATPAEATPAAPAVAATGSANSGLSDRVRRLEAIVRKQQKQMALQKRGMRQIKAEAKKAPAGPAGNPGDLKIGLFSISNADESFKLQLHGRAHIDGIFLDGNDDFNNTFQVRRARITVQARLHKDVTFKLGMEFGHTTDADARDAYINLRFNDAIQLRVGQQIAPFSTERLTTSNIMNHLERPIFVATSVGKRDVGAQLWGKLLDGKVTYHAGIYNGNGENIKSDNNDDKNGFARVELTPTGGVLIASSYAVTATDRTSTGMTDVKSLGGVGKTFLNYDNANNRRRGQRHRVTAEARFRRGPLEVKGEYYYEINEAVERVATGTRSDISVNSFFVDVSFLITGEDKVDVIVPKNPVFGGKTRGMGAFELAFRYDDYRAEREVLRGGYATGANAARAESVTAHWYLAKGVRISGTYTHTEYNRNVTDTQGHLDHGEDSAIFRFTVFF